jgi:hypothetical protein
MGTYPSFQWLRTDAGVPAIEELTLMPTDAHWIPIEDSFELQLVDRLVREGRRFAKCLRYDSMGEGLLASAVLLDTSPSPCVLHVVRSHSAAEEGNRAPHLVSSQSAPELIPWVWHVNGHAMPPLPPRGRPAEPQNLCNSASLATA